MNNRRDDPGNSLGVNRDVKMLIQLLRFFQKVVFLLSISKDYHKDVWTLTDLL